MVIVWSTAFVGIRHHGLLELLIRRRSQPRLSRSMMNDHLHLRQYAMITAMVVARCAAANQQTDDDRDFLPPRFDISASWSTGEIRSNHAINRGCARGRVRGAATRLYASRYSTAKNCEVGDVVRAP